MLHARFLGEVTVLVASAPAIDEAATGILFNIIVPAREGCAARPSDRLWDTVFFIVEDLTSEVRRILLSGNCNTKMWSGDTAQSVGLAGLTERAHEEGSGGAALKGWVCSWS